MERKISCKYCGLKVTRNLLSRHYRMCPLSENNLRLILIWIREYIERFSTFQNIRIYPKAVSYNIFADRNSILSYNSLRRIYPGEDWKTIVELLVTSGVKRNLITDDEFPPYVRAFYSSTQFLEPSAARLKTELIEIEESALLKLRKDHITSVKN